MAGTLSADETSAARPGGSKVNAFAKLKDTPEKHTKDCMLKCESSGYGVITADGKDKKFVKFDSRGNELTVEALKASKKTEGLKATVVGEVSDGTIKVKSIAFD